ncbi:PIG-L deacetylase family protein [Georgenia subflava]|uniref:PIG-L family deacetylase n=1 Tax=Georgenia subflava TaxID=1622177 RepID=A0A6N7EUE7_9MICO|nr:PIG-L deacetylase family protein [Georgenia subflava]MPV38774.1 PIG-L family deacetylase [Georgenia subflava]
METLTRFDDADLSRVLAVVAHPDDMEYGGAAAVATWRARGVEVGYVLATSGEAGIDSLPPEQARPLREREQREACARVGVSDVRFLGFPDGTVERTIELRRAIAAEIRRFRPDTVVTGAFRETWPGGVLNQADHVAVGHAVLDAARDAGNRWVFPELVDQGHAPWGGVRTVLAVGSPLATHGIDVSDGFAAGVASLEAHEEYLAGLGPEAPVPAEMLAEFLGATGQQLGVRHAVAVEVLPLQLF